MKIIYNKSKTAQRIKELAYNAADWRFYEKAN